MKVNPTKYEGNPWFSDHVDAESGYLPFRQAVQAVAQEFAMSEPYSSRTTPCRCGEGTLWYKSTISRHKCDACGTLAAFYGTHPEYLQPEKEEV